MRWSKILTKERSAHGRLVRRQSPVSGYNFRNPKPSFNDRLVRYRVVRSEPRSSGKGVKTLTLQILSIICLQAYSTTTLSDKSETVAADTTGAIECQDNSSSCASDPTVKKIWKWTDENGNVHVTDKVPADFAERPQEFRQGKAACMARFDAAAQIWADMVLLNTYLNHLDPAFRTDARRAKSTKLHIAALEQQLAALEVSEYIPECEEQLRQEIQRIRGEIERHRRILEHNLDGIESIQDPQELDDGMAAKL